MSQADSDNMINKEQKMSTLEISGRRSGATIGGGTVKKKVYALLLMLAFVAGLLGGAVSGRLFAVNLGYAEKEPEPKAYIAAKEFRLVADDGRTLATLGGRPGMEPFMPVSPALHFYDREGQLRILIGLMPGDMPHIDMLDENRNLIWVAPPKSKQ